MNFSLSSKAIASTKADCLVIGLPEKGAWPDSTNQADEALGGLIRTLQKAGDLSGKNATTLTIPLTDQPWSRLLVVGTGKEADRSPANYRKALIAMMTALKDGPSKSVAIALADTPVTGEEAVSSEAAFLSLIGRTLEDQLYTFTDFKSEKPAAQAQQSRCACLQCRQGPQGCLQSGTGHRARHEPDPGSRQYPAQHLPPGVAGPASQETGQGPRLHQDRSA